MNGLEITALGVAFGRTEILSGVNLQMDAGETVALVGSSGGGKTVLLRAIAGLEPTAVGCVRIGERDVTMLAPEARGVGMAFQNFALYPHLPAFENIASPLHARSVAAKDIATRVRRVAAMLRIEHVLEHRPKELSNGQKQRTALARALVSEPDVLLLDDPLRNVDAKLRYEMRLELPRLLKRAGAAAIYVTQDFREAMALGDRVAVLLGGRLVQFATPDEVYTAPVSVAVARLFGDPPMNLLPVLLAAEGEQVQVEAAGLAVRFRDVQGLIGTKALLGLRPEVVQVLGSQTRGAAPAEVVAVTPLHERNVVLLRATGGVEVVASVAGHPPAAGERVWIRAAMSHALLFDATTGRRVQAVPQAREIVA